MYSKPQRITFFIEKLKEDNAQFDHPWYSHRHIKQTLDKVEQTYAESGAYMCVFPFQDFRLLESDRIYYNDQFNKHVVFIAQSGAYAIFEKEPLNSEADSISLNLSYYRQATPIIEISSMTGENIW